MNKAQRALLVLHAKSALEKIAKENMSLGGKGVRIQTPLGRIDEKLARRAHTTRYTIRSVDRASKRCARESRDEA